MSIIPTAEFPGLVSEIESPGAGLTALLKLLAWLSPAFPVGSFSYSHGLEYAIDTGAVRTEAELHGWTSDLLSEGSGWSDAVLLAVAWRAAQTGDAAALRAVAELAQALAPSRERHLETMRQGTAFLDAVLAAWPSSRAAALRRAGEVAYPVAVGAVAAEHGIALDLVLPAWLNAFAGTLVSVAVRLVPLGQSAGLRTLAALHPAIVEIAGRASRSTLDDLGSATLFSDIFSMRHEVQYSRVFRT
jgi:urease accessory protein